MTEELKQDLTSINFDKYIEIFERENLNDFSDLEDLTEDDYEKIGITALGDRKKLVKLYGGQKQEKSLPMEVNNTENTEQNSGNAYQQNAQPTPIIVNNAEHAAHTGLSGVLGGVIGAVAVIAIILIILSNESYTL